MAFPRSGRSRFGGNAGHVTAEVTLRLPGIFLVEVSSLRWGTQHPGPLAFRPVLPHCWPGAEGQPWAPVGLGGDSIHSLCSPLRVSGPQPPCL